MNFDSLPLPLPMPGGRLCIVHLPRMTEQTFEFLKQQLETYKSALVFLPADTNPSDEETPA